MQIITGKTGTNHVKAEDDRALHAATFGTGMYVLDVGSKFGISSSTTNSLTMSDGELMLQGCHARIRHGENETLLFDNGSTGYNRIDLVVSKYQKYSGIEYMDLIVYKGDETTGTPTAPSYVQGNILEGDEEVDMPMYKIELTGLSVVITPLFTVVTGLDDVYRKNEVYTKNEVNSIKNTLQTNVNTAQSTADTALSTANTGVANAAAAQNTANTARQEAATAQSTANTGVANAETAQITANSNHSKIALIEQNCAEIYSEFPDRFNKAIINISEATDLDSLQDACRSLGNVCFAFSQSVGYLLN